MIPKTHRERIRALLVGLALTAAGCGTPALADQPVDAARRSTMKSCSTRPSLLGSRRR